jgi:hypothetical protein
LNLEGLTRRAVVTHPPSLPPSFPQVIHVLLYERRTIMADSLIGEVEVPLSALTEEEFIDTWLPISTRDHHHPAPSSTTPSFSPSHAAVFQNHHLYGGSQAWTAGAKGPPVVPMPQEGGKEGGTQTVWMVRVQVLLSFLLMCAKQAERGESEGEEMGEEEDEEEDEEGEDEETEPNEHQVRATSMMDDL